MKCPVCDVELLLAERHGIEIDYCPKCRGVWLDRGELDSIISRANAVGYGPPPGPGPQRTDRYDQSHQGHQEERHYQREHYQERPYDERHGDRRYDEHHGDKRRKRGSFLEDLFDFD